MSKLLALSDRDCSFTYCILEAPLALIGHVATLRLKPVIDNVRRGDEAYPSRVGCGLGSAIAICV